MKTKGALDVVGARAARIFIIVKIFQAASLGFISTTYVPFLIDNGLDYLQTNLVNVAFMLVNVLLDPLTGSLADKIGQRKTYLLGFVFVGAGSFIYGSGESFLSFVLAESVSAIGTALWSEALEAWLRNLYGKELTHITQSKSKYFARIFGVGFGFVGSFAAASFGLRIPWFLCFTAAVAGLVVGLILTRGFSDPTQLDDSQKKGSLKDSFKLFLHVPELRFTVTVTCISSIAYQALNMYWSIVFSELLGSLKWMGFVWAGISISIAFGSRLVRTWTNPSKTTLGIFTLLTGIPIFVSALFFGKSFWFLLAGFMLHEVTREGADLLLYTFSNDYIPNEIRSTSNSIRSSSRTVGAVIGLLASGFLAKSIHPVQVWIFCGALLIVLSIWIFVSSRRRNR